MASLKVIQGPDQGRIFDLFEGDNIIGRQSLSVPISDRTVSRQHARVFRGAQRWLLADMGSANGTFVNGMKVDQASELHRGDQIRCGSTTLVFIGPENASARVGLDESDHLVDAAIVATMPSNEDSVIIPTPEAGAEAIARLRFLYNLITEIGSIFDVDHLCQVTLDKTFEVVKADRGYVLLLEEGNNGSAEKLIIKAKRATKASKEPEMPLSRTIINEVLTKQVGVLSSNAMIDKRFAAGKSVQNLGIRSAMCAPIKGRERILGIIHVDCTMSKHTYSTEQLRLLTAIGYQAGLALESVRLHEAAVRSERLAATGETVAFLSHHIKNILHALGAGIDVIEMSLKNDNPAKAKDAWAIVQRNIAKINDLILNMLAISKEREPLLESVNINHIINECLELIGPQADERGVAIMNELDDLPPIAADAAGLHQAMLNLLNNALDAVPDRHGAITVRTRFDPEDKQVIISIIDNGHGIEPDKIARIFTAFFSAKGQKGTGLGLAVAEKTVKEHGGRIDVASSVGAGTTFSITLPARSIGLDSGETTSQP